jgi:hypothetical protein
VRPFLNKVYKISKEGETPRRELTTQQLAPHAARPDELTRFTHLICSFIQNRRHSILDPSRPGLSS